MHRTLSDRALARCAPTFGLQQDPSGFEPLESRLLFSTYTVTQTGDSGAGSLRQAITQANAHPGRDTIAFHIGSGARTIKPSHALPTITDPVRIDGRSQPGFAGKPLIELSGQNAGSTAVGLVITAGRSVVQGLVINRFGAGGIVLRDEGGNAIRGNYIGTNAAGSAAAGNGGDGLLVDNTAENTIGGTSALDRNVISGNGSRTNFPTLARDGIHLLGAGAHGNVVQGNYLGTDATGTKAVGSDMVLGVLGNSKFGIELDGAASNQVGGTAPGAGNLVSGNTAGIEIDNGGNHNVVQGNRVGTQKDGKSPLGNILHGVVFGVGQHNDHNLIGGTAPGEANIIAQNGTGGVAVFGSTSTAAHNSILGNSIFSNGRSNPKFLLGIDLVPTLPFPSDDGVTPNDSDDTDAGPNGLQNFPVLLTAGQTGGTVRVTGVLQSRPNQTYRIEFFSNSDAAANVNAEGETFLGSKSVKTNGSGRADFTAVLSGKLVGAKLVTATATSSAGDTSEFSAAVKAGG